MNHPESYCVYDFETTGKYPETARPIQIAAKKVRPGVGPETRSWIVKPKGWSGVLDPAIVELTGITPEQIEREGVDEQVALREFVDFTAGLPLLGHNIVRYDNVILKRLCDEHCPGEILTNLAPLDSCFDTAGIVKGRKLKMEPRDGESSASYAGRVLETRAFGVYYRLKDSCVEMGIDVSDLTAHQADSDVEMTDRLFRRLAA